ncbi:MAG TPA: hypothetical protein VGG64_17855 [Pirellulales bacterium]|jgi:hypothetical protein
MILATAPLESHEPTEFCVGDPPLSWKQICRIERRVLGLAGSAMIARGARNKWRRYEVLKRQLAHLVGYQAINPALRSSLAFDIAHHHVFAGW